MVKGKHFLLRSLVDDGLALRGPRPLLLQLADDLGLVVFAQIIAQFLVLPLHTRTQQRLVKKAGRSGKSMDMQMKGGYNSCRSPRRRLVVPAP